MTNDYGYQHHTYPVFSTESTVEPAFKRLTSFPTPQEVLDFAMFGLPRKMPLTGELVTADLIKPYLESAITQIEMESGANLSEVDHYHHEDQLAGFFESNYMGMRLQRWPATQIIAVRLKYPHSATPTPIQTYTLPPNWVYLRRNKLNIVASIGAVTPTIDNSAAISAGGIFSYLSGFNRGPYTPGSIEVVYKAGFRQDALPAAVADLIKTWAAKNFLMDILPVIFPQNSVNVGIDGVRQDVSFNVTALLGQRLEMLEQKKAGLLASFVKSFGRTVKSSFLGA